MLLWGTLLLGLGFVQLWGVYLAVAAGRCQWTFWGCAWPICPSVGCWSSCSKTVRL